MNRSYRLRTITFVLLTAVMAVTFFAPASSQAHTLDPGAVVIGISHQRDSAELEDGMVWVGAGIVKIFCWHDCVYTGTKLTFSGNTRALFAIEDQEGRTRWKGELKKSKQTFTLDRWQYLEGGRYATFVLFIGYQGVPGKQPKVRVKLGLEQTVVYSYESHGGRQKLLVSVAYFPGDNFITLK